MNNLMKEFEKETNKKAISSDGGFAPSLDYVMWLEDKLEKTQEALKDSNNKLNSILYVPEQVNWSHDSEYKPIWLVQQIK